MRAIRIINLSEPLSPPLGYAMVSANRVFMFVLGVDLPDSIKELQQYFGDGTSNDLTNVFYKLLENEQGMS